ncbi:hypothetical protein [Streptomyces sp. SID14515]|uniref:hypothetical protein n=1 Tax=Streptomyces sp. SID14515 TaxID=2706074 RepID=UPI0013CB72DC|nr:hypothetical protein [Streptomyces sp. SID14515]NEB38028.1 hypothetical protein [Streptomyces sp. SID14515]
MDGFDEIDGLQFSVVYLRAASPNTPRPPGLRSWPEPGEAVVSPGLKAALIRQGEPDRYGEIVGEIGVEGLASPGENYGYVNPTDAQWGTSKAIEVVGFGAESPGPSGDWIFVAPRERLQTGMYLILVPALILAFVAARMGSAGRDRRTALISALGGGARHRFWLNMGESALPVMGGAFVGLMPAVVTMLVDVRIPWIDYVLSAADMKRFWWLLGLGGFSAAAVVLMLVCLLHRTAKRSKSRSTRLASRGSDMIRWAALACPLLLLATVWIPGMLDVAEHSQLRATLYNTGVALVMVTLPCAVAVLAGGAGARLALSARRTGDAGALVAGRHAAAHPGVTARLVAGITIAMVLVTQLQLKNVQYGSAAQAAAATQQVLRESVLLMEVGDGALDGGKLAATLDRLPSDIAVVATYEVQGADESEPPGTRLQAPCGDLKALGLVCSPGLRSVPVSEANARTRTVLQWIGSGPVLEQFEVRQSRPLPEKPTAENRPAALLLVSRDGSPLPAAEIKQTVRTGLPVGEASVGTFGETWLLGANLASDHGRWVVFLGTPGVLLLALAAALANLAEFIRFSRSVAPISVLTGRRRVFWSSAAWGLLAPLLASVMTGYLAAVWLAAPQEDTTQGIELSSSLLVGTAGSLSALAVIIWWCGAYSAIRESSRWRPSGD